MILVRWEPYATEAEIAKFYETVGETPCAMALPYSIDLTGSQLKEIKIGRPEMESVASQSFTETVAVQLIKDSGAQFVLLGTAQSRSLGEQNSTINAKLKAALAQGLEPILCIGESWEEYKTERSAEVLTTQLAQALQGADFEGRNLIIVYEAPWIKQGHYLCSKEECNHAYNFCRDLVASLYGDETFQVYCPVNPSISDPQSLFEFIQADGYYLDHPISFSGEKLTLLPKAVFSVASELKEKIGKPAAGALAQPEKVREVIKAASEAEEEQEAQVLEQAEEESQSEPGEEVAEVGVAEVGFEEEATEEEQEETLEEIKEIKIPRGGALQTPREVRVRPYNILEEETEEEVQTEATETVREVPPQSEEASKELRVNKLNKVVDELKADQKKFWDEELNG